MAYAVELRRSGRHRRARLDLHAMRRSCWPLLAVVVVALRAQSEVLKYPLGVTPIFNWILWGYGISIAALVDRPAALYGRPATSGCVRAGRGQQSRCSPSCWSRCRCAASSSRDAMDVPDHGFMERSFYVLVWRWLCAGGTVAAARNPPARVVLWTWRVSGGLAVALVLVRAGACIANPVFVRTISAPAHRQRAVPVRCPAAMAA